MSLDPLFCVQHLHRTLTEALPDAPVAATPRRRRVRTALASGVRSAGLALIALSVRLDGRLARAATVQRTLHQLG